MQAPFADPLTGSERPVQQLPLFGRESEVRAIRSVLDSVTQDRPVGPRALMISGDVGIGKSRLLAEMYEEAGKRNFRVLEGRAYEAGALFPYLPFIDALRPVLRTQSVKALCLLLGLDRIEPGDSRLHAGASISLIGTPLLAALARLFPELPHRLSATIHAEALTPEQEKFRLFDAVATVLERLGEEKPVMLGIDNLHWADSATLELTLYLTVRLRGCRVALAGVTRPSASRQASIAESDGNESERQANKALQALNELMRQGLLLFLPVQPLGMAYAEQHLHALLPGPISGAETLLARAGGNPFFLEELVRMLTLDDQLIQHHGVWDFSRLSGTELPRNISLAVERRLQVLSTSCLELMRVAALFGRTFPLQALMMVVGEGETRTQECIEEAQQASIIAPSRRAALLTGDDQAARFAERDGVSQGSPSQVYIFCQGIVQEVLSSQVPLYQAGRLHGGIGAALEKYYGLQAPAGELARHYVLSGEQAAALRWSMRAGEEAAGQQAYREAIAHFRAVLTLMERHTSTTAEEEPYLLAQVHEMIGDSWFRTGELDQAAEAFQKALAEIRRRELEETSTQPRLSAALATQVNRMLADVYRMQGKYELTLAHLQAARNALDSEVVGLGESAVTEEEEHHYAWMTARSFSGGSIRPAQRRLSAERVLLLQAQATMDLLLNRGAEAERALWQSYQLATELGDRASQAFALHMVSWIRGWGEQIHEAIRLQEQAYELYVAIGDPFRAALGDQGLAIIHLALGEIEAARLYNVRGFELARRYGIRHVIGWLYWNQAVMELATGQWAECESHLQLSMREAEAGGNARLKPVILQVQAQLAFRRGEWNEAEQLFQAALTTAANTEWYPAALALFGHFLAVIGRTAKAKVQLEKAAAMPEPIGYSGHYYIPFLAEGFLHIGVPEQASIYIERIKKLKGFMYYGVAVDRIRGEVAALDGDWNEAERAFDDGLRLCKRVGNQPEEAAILYEEARTFLMRLGRQDVPSRLSLERMHELCQAAREIFERYEMLRSVGMVDTLQEGLHQLDARNRSEAPRKIVANHLAHAEYILELHLTQREVEVLRLVAEGHTDREVAEALVISHRTVNRHLSNMFVKLDVPGRAAAVAFAIRQGLVG